MSDSICEIISSIESRHGDIFEYTITPYGRTLKELIVEIEMWGIKHRDTIMRKAELNSPVPV